MNFVLGEWKEICRLLSSMNCVLASQKNLNDNFLIVKHDVETKPKNALKMALIENENSIKATYYVQANVLFKNPEIFHKIRMLGHEIGYHYDVLDECDGDLIKANKLFRANIEKFSNLGFEINTICPHGNPLKKRVGWNSNRDYWEAEITDDIRYLFDVVVDMPKMKGLDYTYISDAGYGFKIIEDITQAKLSDENKGKLENIKYLIEAIEKQPSVLSTHPHRWNNSKAFSIGQRYIFNLVKVLARSLYKIPLFRYLINKFYFVARLF